MSKAVFSGNYVDMKFIRSRSACQIVLEIPLERAADFIAAFGAPNPGIETPVAIARLDPNKAKTIEVEPAPSPVKDKKHWDQLPPSQQAAIRCGEPGFWKYLGRSDKDAAADEIRARCGIKSRSELNTNERAAIIWKTIDDIYICGTRGYEEMQH